MPVNSKHSSYVAMIGKWERCRDAMRGQDAVHAKGEAYLPKLKEQDDADYKSYVKRASWYNATWRTIAGLKGMLLRKPPQVDVPESVSTLLDDVTLAGQPLQILLATVCEESLGLGRVGVLVDYPVVGSPYTTLKDARDQNLRPTMCLYRAESIYNWKVENILNRATLTMVVLCEQAYTPQDKYSAKAVEQYRVLQLSDQGNYEVEIWQIVDGKEVFVSAASPMMHGKPMTYIPFVFLSADDTTPEVDEPPLIDLVDVNYSHYRTTADYEHAAHFVGLPTPVVTGYRPEKEGEKLYIGASHAWIFPSADADAKFLEFTGQGLEALVKVLERKEQQMATLGARMLEPMTKQPAAAEGQSIRRKGEESMLSETAQAISLGMTTALRWFCDWADAPDEEADVELNRDFWVTPMTFQMLTSLVSAWQANAISDQVLFDNLQRGEVIPPDLTLEDMQAQIASQPPRTLSVDDVIGALSGPRPGQEGGVSGAA